MKNFRRSFVFFLCLSLVIGVALPPLQVDASPVWAASFALRSVAGSLIASGFDDIVKEPFLDACNSIVDLFSAPLTEALKLAQDKDNLKFTLTELFVREVVNIYKNNPIIRQKMGLDPYDTSKDPVLISQGTTIYVPSQSAIENVESITQDQVLYTGFEREAIDLLTDIKYSLDRLPALIGYNISNALSNSFASINDSVLTLPNRVANALSTSLWNIQSSVSSAVGSLHGTTEEMRMQLYEHFAPVIHNIEHMRLDMYSHFSLLENILTEELSKLRWNASASLSSVESKIETLTDKIDTLIETLTVPKTEVVTKPEVNVQVGTQTIVVSDYSTMQQAFTAKMSWVPQIFDFLRELRSRLHSSTAPKIPIRLSASEGSYDWGSDVYILDMTWYARYKPSVDTILSGIMWLCFGWALYKRIPDILSGVGLTVENATESRGHVWSERAARAERQARYHKGG